MLLPIVFLHLFLLLHQLAVRADDICCLMCSLNAQSVLCHKAECHPGMVVELEIGLLLHADL